MVSSREEALNILGVSKYATFAEIKKAYRNLALKFHSDRPVPNGFTRETADDELKKITVAFGYLERIENDKKPDRKESVVCPKCHNERTSLVTSMNQCIICAERFYNENAVQEITNHLDTKGLLEIIENEDEEPSSDWRKYLGNNGINSSWKNYINKR